MSSPGNKRSNGHQGETLTLQPFQVFFFFNFIYYFFYTHRWIDIEWKGCDNRQGYGHGAIF